MRAADTNVVLRTIARDDVGQLPAAEAFIANGAWVSHVVLAEVVWVLESRYGRDHAEITTIVEMLLQHEQFALEDERVVAAALQTYRQHSSSDFNDCLILEIARKAGHLPLGTFDKNLAKIEGAKRL